MDSPTMLMEAEGEMHMKDSKEGTVALGRNLLNVEFSTAPGRG